jgi:MFS transporter, CP family, cyanate transporter
VRDEGVPAETGAAASPADRRTFGKVLLVAGIAALGFNLRPAITSLPPVFPELADSLSLSQAAISALATIPVLCFGVFSGFAAKASRRFGDEEALFASLILLTAGLTLRGLFPHAALFPATVLAAGAIAIMNVLLSGLIKRRMPRRAGLLIGIYLLSLSVGSIIGSLIAVPMYQLSGGSAHLALGLWAVPAAVAVVAWLPQVLRRRARGSAVARRGTSAVVASGTGRVDESAPPLPPQPRAAGYAVHRHLLAWQVACFMGLQSLAFYSTLSWLPTLFRDRGASPARAGVLISIMSLGGVITALVIPMIAHRIPDQRRLVVPTVLLSGIGIGAALFAPLGTEAVWMFLLGFAQGSSLGLAIFFTMARAATPAIAASLSSLAQSAGYLVAAAGPLLVGFLHSATGGWRVPIFLLLAVTVGQLAAGYLAARPRIIE